MNKEKQRTAIAEACEWTDVLYNYVYGDWFGRRPNEERDRYVLPDYLSDFNAAREILKFIPDRVLFRQFLLLVVLDDPTNPENEPAFATAAQWCEAFLRMIGKWEEVPA